MRKQDVMRFDEATGILATCREDHFFRVGEESIVERRNSWPMGGEESCEAVGYDAHQSEVELHLSSAKQKEVGWYFPPFSLKQPVGGLRSVGNIFLVWCCVFLI